MELPGLGDVLKSCRPTGSSQANILRALLAVQEALGAVPPDAIPKIARALAVTDATVAGVLSFYPDLRSRPAGCRLIRVCLGESCVANHSGRVLAALEAGLKIGVGDTTPDGRFTLERVYCVGNCAVSPTVMIDEEVRGRLTASEVPALIEEFTGKAITGQDSPSR
jgi:NADH:ubiquinone oxidoreductase subunit E